MTSHGTALQVTPGIVREFHSAVIAQLPDLTDEEMQKFNRNKGEFGRLLRIALGLLNKPQAQSVEESVLEPVLPADGVEFELTLGTIDPMEMVKGSDFDPEGWEFTGFKIVPQTRKFKLVRVGSCRNLDEVREKLAQHGSIPEGQWREAFKKAFPKNDGQGLIGFADLSWVNLLGVIVFPVLIEEGEAWRSDFFLAGGDRDKDWRWLIASK